MGGWEYIAIKIVLRIMGGEKSMDKLVFSCPRVSLVASATAEVSWVMSPYMLTCSGSAAGGKNSIPGIVSLVKLGRYCFEKDRVETFVVGECD